MGIHVKNIEKRFKDFVALDNINLEVKSGELIALLGPSGSGKTTLLRIIAGLEQADGGSVILDGEEAQNKHIKDRHVGFVFQHYALFKHMTVYDNVAFGLRVRPKDTRPTEAEIRRKVMTLLELVHLENFHTRYPNQLSGGQRQRVALARALAVEPKVLLLDEPFGALDAKVRKELRRWMRRLHDEIHVTSIFVTHDQEEAMEVSDRVVVMSNGRIEQVGTPEEVYHAPANSFVYDFLGNYNEFEGYKDEKGDVHLAEYDLIETSKTEVYRPGGFLARYPEVTGILNKIVPGIVQETKTAEIIRKHAKPRIAGQGVKIYARPHEMFIARSADDGEEYIKGKVVHINPAGPLVRIDIERPGGKIVQAEIQKNVVDQLAVKSGEEVLVRPKVMKVFG